MAAAARSASVCLLVSPSPIPIETAGRVSASRIFQAAALVPMLALFFSASCFITASIASGESTSSISSSMPSCIPDRRSLGIIWRTRERALTLVAWTAAASKAGSAVAAGRRPSVAYAIMAPSSSSSAATSDAITSDRSDFLTKARNRLISASACFFLCLTISSLSAMCAGKSIFSRVAAYFSTNAAAASPRFWTYCITDQLPYSIPKDSRSSEGGPSR